MRTDPQGRYETAKALAEDVRRYLADERVTAYSEPITARLWRIAVEQQVGKERFGPGGIQRRKRPRSEAEIHGPKQPRAQSFRVHKQSPRYPPGAADARPWPKGRDTHPITGKASTAPA